MSQYSGVSMSDLTLPPRRNTSQTQSFLSIESENWKNSRLIKPPLIYPMVPEQSIVIRKMLATIEVSTGRTEPPEYLTDIEKWTKEGDLHFLDSKIFFHPAGANGPAVPITKIPTCLSTDWNGHTTIYPGSVQRDMPSSVPSEQSEQITGQRGGCSGRG